MVQTHLSIRCDYDRSGLYFPVEEVRVSRMMHCYDSRLLRFQNKFQNVVGNQEYFKNITYLRPSNIVVGRYFFVEGIFFSDGKRGSFEIYLFGTLKIKLIQSANHTFIILIFDYIDSLIYGEEIIRNDFILRVNEEKFSAECRFEGQL